MGVGPAICNRLTGSPGRVTSDLCRARLVGAPNAPIWAAWVVTSPDPASAPNGGSGAAAVPSEVTFRDGLTVSGHFLVAVRGQILKIANSPSPQLTARSGWRNLGAPAGVFCSPGVTVADATGHAVTVVDVVHRGGAIIMRVQPLAR
jgi:hypothetical protein